MDISFDKYVYVYWTCVMYVNCCFSFTAKMKSVRKCWEPAKNSIYWDMNIPTQFYEQEYLEFEKYLEFTHVQNLNSPEEPHGNSEYYLEQFAMYEKFRKAEEIKCR